MATPAGVGEAGGGGLGVPDGAGLGVGEGVIASVMVGVGGTYRLRCRFGSVEPSPPDDMHNGVTTASRSSNAMLPTGTATLADPAPSRSPLGGRSEAFGNFCISSILRPGAGCVDVNSSHHPPAEKGETMKKLPPTAAPLERRGRSAILASALESASGSPVIATAVASARYSLCRLTAWRV